MTESERNRSPDFFEDQGPDPVSTATGYYAANKAIPKKKAGFYLSENLLERFNRLFHQMKIVGIPIENKSALVEILMRFGLDDLDKGPQSLLLKALKMKGIF